MARRLFIALWVLVAVILVLFVASFLLFSIGSGSSQSPTRTTTLPR